MKVTIEVHAIFDQRKILETVALEIIRNSARQINKNQIEIARAEHNITNIQNLTDRASSFINSL